MAIFRFFLNGSPPPCWICFTRGSTTHEEHLMVFDTAEFGCNQYSSLDSIQVLMLCEFGLKMPIYPIHLGFFGTFEPLVGVKKKVKASHILDTERWARSWSRRTGSQPAGDYKSSTRRQAAITFRQACGYLPSLRASPPLGRYQVILLGDRGT